MNGKDHWRQLRDLFDAVCDLPPDAWRAELERLRTEFQRLCGFSGGRLVLASGATEANNWVVRGLLDRDRDGRILLSPDVHASLWNACRRAPGLLMI